MKTFKQHYFILTFLLALSGFSLHAQAGTPIDQMKSTVDEMMSVLRNDSTWEQKEPVLRELISKRFYYRAMAQRTLATNWKKASDAQKKEFIDLFSELLLFTYLDRIKAYTDEKVEFKREKLKKKTAVVYTEIITGTANIPINYKLLLSGSNWLVYDVIIEEVSLVSNYRSTYKEIVKKDGIDGLLKKMSDKNKELTASK
ncbi:MAG TPA: ABC transporter substrate-binding protein [Gammaproteobacteria bacterium]|nr:ABC transporter substrate-binding protein [Gammaproteobacteria bacterium]